MSEFALPGQGTGFVDLSGWRQILYDFSANLDGNLHTEAVSQVTIRRAHNRKL